MAVATVCYRPTPFRMAPFRAMHAAPIEECSVISIIDN
jgi:hypothetical protein